MDLMRIQKKLQKAFQSHGVELAYLFGSQIQGKTTSASDVDLAVLFAETLTPEARFEKRLLLIGALTKLLHQQADVVVLNDTRSLFFKYVILKEGELLYERTPGVAPVYGARIFGLYFDFAPFLAQYHRAYVARNLQ